jgi:hypothetical protein
LLSFFFSSSRNDSPIFQVYYTFQDPRVEEYIQELKLAGQTSRSTSPRSEKKKQKKDRQRETETDSLSLSLSLSLSVAESLRSSKTFTTENGKKTPQKERDV